jgi:hypothetical protein
MRKAMIGLLVLLIAGRLLLPVQGCHYYRGHCFPTTDIGMTLLQVAVMGAAIYALMRRA